MSDLSAEQFEQLPDFIKGDYSEVEADGVKVYRHAGVLKLKGTLNDLDGKLKATSSKLTEYEATQAQRQAEAEQAAFEKMKKEGKIDEILEDQRKRYEASDKEKEEKYTKLQNIVIRKAVDGIALELAGEIATDKGRALVRKEIASRVQFDPETDRYTFLAEDGSATSLDLSGFKAELIKSDTLAPLIKAEVSTGGKGLGGMDKGAGGAGVKTGKLGGTKEERIAYFESQLANLKE
jgi:hypothetical protein